MKDHAKHVALSVALLPFMVTVLALSVVIATGALIADEVFKRRP